MLVLEVPGQRGQRFFVEVNLFCYRPTVCLFVCCFVFALFYSILLCAMMAILIRNLPHCRPKFIILKG